MFTSLRYFLSLFIILNLTKIISSDDPNCFRAAVYEHIRIVEPINNPVKIIDNNLAIYEKVLRRSSYENVNIILFPEFGLTPNFDKQTVLSNGLSAIAPDLNSNPCKEYTKQLRNIRKNTSNQTLKNELLDELNQETEKQKDENVLSNKAILRKLSCLAKKYEMYIVVNLMELKISEDQEPTTTVNPQTETDDQSTTTEISLNITDVQKNSLKDQETTRESNEIDDNKSTIEQDQFKNTTDNLELTTNISETTTESEKGTTTERATTERATTEKATTERATTEKATTESTTTESTTTESTTTESTTTESTTTESTTTDDQITKKSTNQKYKIYNADFVFDNKGELIAKYRKFNLFGEDATISRPEKADLVTFENKWGKFGLAICFDMIWQHPVKDLVEKQKIDHLLFSTKWYDYYPNLPALNFHPSASTKYGINILGANNRNLSIGSFGSGIFSKGDVRVQTKFNNNERLLIAELPVGKSKLKGKLEDYECKHSDKLSIGKKEYGKFSYRLEGNTDFNDYQAKQAPFDDFKSKLLDAKKGKIDNFCNQDVCCNLEWKMGDQSESDHYYLIVSNKIRNSSDPNANWYEESCSVVNYDKSTKQFKYEASTHFKNLNLTGNFNTDNIFPNVLSSRLNSVSKNHWTFDQNKNVASITLHKLRNPVNYVTLYARNFEKDPIKN